MKLLILVFALVSVTYQQYYPRMAFGGPWLPELGNWPIGYDGPHFGAFTLNGPSYDEYNNEELLGRNRYPANGNIMGNNIQPRIKGFGFYKKPAPPIDQQQNARFFFNNNNGAGFNPLFRTVRIVTATCTALTVSTCVPLANLPPAPVPGCGRKRRSDLDDEDEDEEDDDIQFPVIPTAVQQATSTLPPDAVSLQPPGARSSVSDDKIMYIFSSKEEDTKTNGVAEKGESAQQEPAKIKRFLNNNGRQQIGQWTYIGTTSTTWTVVSSTMFSTLFVPGPSTVLPCLPSNFVVCPITG